MWYVNQDFKFINNICDTCFILTMWYVNAAFTLVQSIFPLCFILTMWYVNTSWIKELGITEDVLY